MYLSGTFYIFTIDRFKTLLTKSNNKGSETQHIHIAQLLSDVLVMKIGLFMIFHRTDYTNHDFMFKRNC